MLGVGGVDLVVGFPGIEAQVDDAWREVHGTREHAGEGEGRVVVGRIAAVATPGVEFLAAGALAAEEVGPSPANARVFDGFVDVHADAAAGGSFDCALVMLDHPLAVVVFAARDDGADVAGFDRALAEARHEVVGRIELRFVGAHGGARFVVGDQLEALGGGF